MSGEILLQETIRWVHVTPEGIQFKHRSPGGAQCVCGASDSDLVLWSPSLVVGICLPEHWLWLYLKIQTEQRKKQVFYKMVSSGCRSIVRHVISALICSTSCRWNLVKVASYVFQILVKSWITSHQPDHKWIEKTLQSAKAIFWTSIPSLSAFSCVSKTIPDSPTFQMLRRITAPRQSLQKERVGFKP